MTGIARSLPIVAVTLIATLAVACGSQLATMPPVTAPTSATPAPASPTPPATSPTPVPGSPTDPLEAGVWRARLVMPDGTFALPVVLRDASGLVTGIAGAPPGRPSGEETITNANGQPDVLLYTWLGGACDTVTNLTFERADGGFRLRATTETTGQICILIGLERQLLIRLDEPVDATKVVLAPP